MFSYSSTCTTLQYCNQIIETIHRDNSYEYSTHNDINHSADMNTCMIKLIYSNVFILYCTICSLKVISYCITISI